MYYQYSNYMLINKIMIKMFTLTDLRCKEICNVLLGYTTWHFRVIELKHFRNLYIWYRKCIPKPYETNINTKKHFEEIKIHF